MEWTYNADLVFKKKKNKTKTALLHRIKYKQLKTNKTKKKSNSRLVLRTILKVIRGGISFVIWLPSVCVHNYLEPPRLGLQYMYTPSAVYILISDYSDCDANE